MLALSLWQPWATLIAVGAKTIETRSWATSYRGPLVIHAAKHWNNALARLCGEWPFRDALASVPAGLVPGKALPFGAAIAIATLADIRPTETFTGIDRVEREFGDYSGRRYGWVLQDVRPLRKPVPMRGYQQLWALEPGDVARVETAL